MGKRRELMWGMTLLSLVSGLCLAGMKAIDRKLAAAKAKGAR